MHYDAETLVTNNREWLDALAYDGVAAHLMDSIAYSDQWPHLAEVTQSRLRDRWADSRRIRKRRKILSQITRPVFIHSPLGLLTMMGILNVEILCGTLPFGASELKVDR
jgi:hypothetical protein